MLAIKRVITMLLLCIWSTPLYATALSTPEIEPLLEYQQYQNTEKRIRQQLQREPGNAEAWHALAQALEGQKHHQEAKKAYDRAVSLGYSRRWKSQISLSAFSDSNVTLSPAIIDLPAQDQGDVVILLKLNLNATLLKQSWGHTEIAFNYEQSNYQDLNLFGLSVFGLHLQQFVHTNDSYELQFSAGINQYQLNNSHLYKELMLQFIGRYALNDNWDIIMKHKHAKKNYSFLYEQFTGTNWWVGLAVQGHVEHIHAYIEITSGQKGAKIPEEAYHLTDFIAQVSYHVWESEAEDKDIIVWTRVRSEGRFYQYLDSRVILKKPRLRQDTETQYTTGIDFRRSKSIFGDKANETWRLKGGAHFNVSNFNKRAYNDPTLSREWKRWWVAVEFIWNY